mgnify:CR=1 FL=1
MRAAIFEAGDRGLSIATLPDPTPGEGQVVIKVGRCGICGSDLHMAEGPRPRFRQGAVPGHEFAGEIVARGRSVDDLKIGDRVAVLPLLSCGCCSACLAGDPVGCAGRRMIGSGVNGGFAEYAVADARWCVKLPDTLGFADGALVEPLAVSLRAARASGIKAGDRVLVIGAGAIGIAAAYWARRAGASKIVVSATSTRREAIARAVDADAFITPQEGHTLPEQLLEILGAPADIVFECAGVPGSLGLAISAIRRGGTVASPGFCWTPDPFEAIHALTREATIKYTNMYDRREYEIAVDALDAGHVQPRAMVTQVVSLDGAPSAFQALQSGAPQCKVQIAPH